MCPDGNFFFLEQRALPRRHVVVVDAGRRRHRRVAEAQRRRVELEPFHHAERERFLGERDGVLLAGAEVADDDPRQARFPLEPDEVVEIDGEIEDQPPRHVRNQIAPVAAIGRRRRRRDDLEIFRPAGVGQDEQPVAGRIVAMADRVLLSDQPLRDDARLAVRRIGVNDANLRCLVIVRIDDDEAPRQRLADRDEEARIGVLIHRDVVAGIGADDMPEYLRRPVVGVDPHIEQRLAVVGPDRRAARSLDRVRKVEPGLHVAQPEREVFVALLVDRIRHQAMVGAVREPTQAEIGFARRHAATVQYSPLSAPVARRPDHRRMLSTMLVAGPVGERPVGHRNRGIVLLDPPAHLLEKTEPQPLDVGHLIGGIGIFGFEVGADVRRQRRRVVHHRLPVFGP